MTVTTIATYTKLKSLTLHVRCLLVIWFFCGLAGATQSTTYANPQIDSLRKVIEAARHDSIRIHALVDWDELVYVSDPEQDYLLNQQILKICQGNLSQKLSEAETHFFKKYQAMALNNLGLIYWKQGDYALATDHHTRALKIREALDDKQGISGSLGNIGLIYWSQLDYDKAEEYCLRSLEIDKTLNDKQSMAATLNNLGLIKNEQGQDSIAIIYHQKALSIRNEINDLQGVAYSYINIGLIYQGSEKYAESLELYQKSRDILLEIGDEAGEVGAIFGIGSVYRLKGEWHKAIAFFEQAYVKAEKNKLREDLKKTADAMSFCYRKLGDYKNALTMQDIYLAHKDTLERTENAGEVYRQEFKYKYEKQAHADSIKQAESDKLKDAKLSEQEAINEKQQILQYVMAGGIVLILIFFVTLYIRFREIRKQKAIIETQKVSLENSNLLLELKTREVIDSIAYAQRIQEAYLPPQNQLTEYFPDSFLFYRPKDILSGDFYWFHQLKSADGHLYKYVAVADCTGHGVPGAIMSVICSAALTESVTTAGKTTPSEILTTARTILLKNLKNTETHTTKDGMDVSLMRLNQTTRELVYAGAHNPLWIYDEQGKLTELKGDKQPVGSFDFMQPFTEQTITLSANCAIYLSSDGFQDQFGGAHLPNGRNSGKKFKAANLKKLLTEMSQKPMSAHPARLDNTFNDWRGDLEQVDDVCVIGVRF